MFQGVIQGWFDLARGNPWIINTHCIVSVKHMCVCVCVPKQKMVRVKTTISMTKPWFMTMVGHVDYISLWSTMPSFAWVIETRELFKCHDQWKTQCSTHCYNGWIAATEARWLGVCHAKSVVDATHVKQNIGLSAENLEALHIDKFIMGNCKYCMHGSGAEQSSPFSAVCWSMTPTLQSIFHLVDVEPWSSFVSLAVCCSSNLHWTQLSPAPLRRRCHCGAGHRHF